MGENLILPLDGEETAFNDATDLVTVITLTNDLKYKYNELVLNFNSLLSNMRELQDAN